MRRLTTLFPSDYLEEHAEELGVIERDGKIQIPVFVWVFVFGFAAGESRTLAGFKRSYNSTSDETISPGGFYQRLTPSLAEYSATTSRAVSTWSLSPTLLTLTSTAQIRDDRSWNGIAVTRVLLR